MQLLASGRDADVYDYGGSLVLRRYRDGRDASAEAELMRRLAGLGYPVPHVERNDGPDLVLARIVGPTLADSVLSGTVPPATGGRLMAQLHDHLHHVTRSGGEALLHLDLHPANVLLGADGPVLIDWCNARRGPPALDLAMTALIVAQVLLAPDLVISDPTQVSTGPALIREILIAYASQVSPAYLDFLDDAAALRREDPNLSPTERTLLPTAVALARAPVSGR